MRSLHLYNMFVMRKDLLDDYAAWLFDILFEVDRQAGEVAEDSAYQARWAGFLGERLMNVWLNHQKLSVVSLPIARTDSESTVRKAGHLLLRKYGLTKL